MDRTRLLAVALVCAFVVAVAVNAVTGASEPARMEFENDSVTLVTADESYDLNLSDGESFEEVSVETRPSGTVSLRVTDSVTYDEVFEVRQVEANESRKVDVRDVNLSVDSRYRLESDSEAVIVRRVPEDVEVLEADETEVEYNVKVAEASEFDEVEIDDGDAVKFDVEGIGDENQTDSKSNTTKKETDELR